MSRDPNVDSLAVIYVPPLVTRPDEVAAAIARGAGAVPADKPIVSVFMSSRRTPELLARGPRGPIPSYSFPENVAITLAAAVRYGQWRARPTGTRLALTPDQGRRSARRSRRAGTAGSLERIAALLATVGVMLADFRVVEPDPAAARRVCARRRIDRL